MLVYGTDGELNLASALSSVFNDAIHLRCDIHLKDNVKSALAKYNVPQAAKTEIFKDVFGFEVSGEREGGLVDCNSETEFQTAIETATKKWKGFGPQAAQFCEFFLENHADVIKESMRADIRSMCGLGFPPVAYSQNAIECINRYVKENSSGSENVTKSLVKAVVNINNVVKRQFDEQFLAVIGKGTYRLAKGFEFLGIKEDAFYQMSAKQKEGLKQRFFDVSVSAARGAATKTNNPSKLSLEADASGIISVPFDILEQMFIKAKKLVGKTWKIPGTEETWMVPSSHDPKSPHTVTTFGNGRVSCDKACVNYCAYTICAHAVAVAEDASILSNFCKWYRSKRSTSNLTSLSNVGLPEKSGQKGVSSTKRRKGAANKKKNASTAVLSNRVLPTQPARPEPAFGTFALASLKYLHPKVSVCYGCRQSLKNNEQIPSSPKDLVIVSRLRREYYKDDQKKQSPDLTNVYYHLNPNCVAEKHAFFIPALVQVPSDLKPFLDDDHKDLLCKILGVKVA